MEQAVALGNVRSSVEISVDVATVKLRASPEAFAKIAKAVISPSRQRATQAGKSKSMKQIGLAIHNYYAQHNHLPPRCFTDEAGNPLHSIRVALLPHLEQAAMYKLIKLDQRWNSDDNQKFADTRIPVYCDDPDRSAKTTIRFPVYPGSVWHGEGPPKDFRSIIDGTSNTIAAVDAPENVAIEWPNPEPWVLSVDDPMSDIFGDRDSVTVLMLDGAAVVLQKADVTNEKLKGLLTFAGREKIKL